MEIILKLLHCQHVDMIILMDWPITVGRQWPQDLGLILTALSKQKCTISQPIYGTTLLIILLARKYLFMISAFKIYSPTLRSQPYVYYSVASTNQAAFFIGEPMETHILQSLLNMKRMSCLRTPGLFMEISKNHEVFMDQ